MSAEQVHADVRRLNEATFAGDIETVLELTHAQVIAALGESAREQLTQALDAIQTMQLKLARMEFPSPPEFFAGTENEFVVVPVVSTIVMAGEEMENATFQLGARRPGESWRYVEGGRLDAAGLLDYFPDFPPERLT